MRKTICLSQLNFPKLLQSQQKPMSVIYSLQKPFQLLYVEDDVDDLKFFSDAVKASSLPIEVSNAKDSTDLRHQLMNGLIPDAILLDVNLPFFSALDFVGELKSNQIYESTPIVIFSTYPLHRYFHRCIEAGAAAYLVKPNELDKWVSAVENLFLNNYSNNIHKSGRFRAPSVSGTSPSKS